MKQCGTQSWDGSWEGASGRRPQREQWHRNADGTVPSFTPTRLTLNAWKAAAAPSVSRAVSLHSPPGAGCGHQQAFVK